MYLLPVHSVAGLTRMALYRPKQSCSVSLEKKKLYAYKMITMSVLFKLIMVNDNLFFLVAICFLLEFTNG